MPGLGRKVFTAGDVLTASDVQSYLQDQTVMNFAGTAARSSAIATPTDGMVTYNQTNDQLEAYNGSAWVGMSGLQLIKKQTIGSGVSAVAVTGAFSTTYENYLIVISGGVASGQTVLNTILGATVTGYYGSYINASYTSTTVSSANDNNTARWLYTGFADTNSIQSYNVIGAPFLSKNTTIKGTYVATSTTASSGTYAGYLNNSTSYTDFTITANTGGVTLTGGTIYVYGYGT